MIISQTWNPECDAGTSFTRMANIKLLEPPIDNPVSDLKQHWHARYHQDPASRWMREQIYALFHEALAPDGSLLADQPEPWEV